MKITQLKVNDKLYDVNMKCYIVKKIYCYYAVDLEYDGKVVQQYSQFLNSLHTKEEVDAMKAARKDLLKAFIQSRGIEHLIHFTSRANLESIKQHGILPRASLDEMGLPYQHNDDYRYDGYNDAISLSITNPNNYVLKRFVEEKSLDPVILKIDAALLYEEFDTKRIYCVTNAATYSTQSSNGETLEHFKNLFKEKLSYEVAYGGFSRVRTREGLADNIPTDLQAEILFFGRIDPKYFVSIEV